MFSLPKFIPLTFLLFFTIIVPSRPQQFYETLNPKSHGLGREKLSHIHFYFHDVLSGHNPTSIRVAESPSTNSSATLFGAVFVIDDPLTVSPENTSRVVGKAQGLYLSASQNDVGLLMVLNFIFTEGKYNGSTLSVLGRNAGLVHLRELPILGGSGIFRFARGYAKLETHFFDPITGDAIVKYDLYVFHY